MANILYRETNSGTTPPAPDAVKGLPLTNAEFDANLKSINDDIQTRVTMTTFSTTATTLADNALALAVALS